MTTSVSIIICTCNRAESLRRTLNAIGEVEVPPRFYPELLVVDSGSTDHTADVVKSTLLPNMSVRYLRIPQPGKSVAYNAGMAAAQSEILLFTDDDLIPPPHWIGEMCAPILAGKAQAVAGGVSIAPHLKRAWMQPNHYGIYASTELLQPDVAHQMYGANMAFSRAVLARVPGFDPALGPGRPLGCNDDSLFSWQLSRAGFTLVPAFHIIAEHHFDASRLRRSSLLQHAAKAGRSWAYVRYHWKHDTIKYPRLGLLWYTLYLAYLRSVKGHESISLEGCPTWEISTVETISFYKQYLLERSQPHKYAKFGLVKLPTAGPGSQTQ